MNNTNLSKSDIDVKKKRSYFIFQILYQFNDFLIGILFLIGSIMFLRSGMMKLGVYLFIAGSLLMLIRPGIAIVRDIHVAEYNRKELELTKRRYRRKTHSSSIND